MKGCLLDANLLIALAWPNHVHHDRGHAWFAEQRAAGWGTCTVTQLAFVRISSHPSVQHHVSTQAALEKLAQIIAEPGHGFWPEPPDGLRRPAFAATAAALLTHSMVTDGYLAAVAAFNSGRLATLDKQLAGTFPAHTVLV